MQKNNSPWLTQLRSNRDIKTISQDTKVDVCIVGGGIAGVATAYFLLSETDKTVLLLEGGKIAHGATGHNAGQVVAEFEKPLSQIAHEHGMRLTIEGVRLLESAWDTLDALIKKTGITVPYKQFIGYGGYSTLEQLKIDIQTEYIKHVHDITSFPILISRESGWFQRLDKIHQQLCVVVDQDSIKKYLGTISDMYHAVIPQKKGVVNSALLVEQLAFWCSKNFPKRFSLYEHSFVHGIELGKQNVVVITNSAKITAKETVLCTNGFENFYIHTQEGLLLDTAFHHDIQGAVGYMSGFLSDQDAEYYANYFYEPDKIRRSNPFSSDPYFYVTKRDFDIENKNFKLFTVGGPEVQLENREIYQRDFDIAHSFHEDSLAFTKKHFDMKNLKEKFFWHGLMGYTRSGLRMVGREPLDRRLLYNLGCNGVGILTSIMGARLIAAYVNKEQIGPTIFQPTRV